MVGKSVMASLQGFQAWTSLKRADLIKALVLNKEKHTFSGKMIS
jgi:hypothetical protein